MTNTDKCSFSKFFSKHKFALINGAFGLAAVATFFFPTDLANNWLFNVARILVILVFIVLTGVALYRGDTFDKFQISVKNASKSAKILMVALPLIVLAAVAVQLANPDFAVWLIRCDDHNSCGLNFRHAIFIKAAFDLIAAGIFIGLIPRLVRQKHAWTAALVSLIALILLIMVGEELSWGQRIFFFATPDSVKDLNAQGEMNLHNLSTQLFQNAWYFGAWIILVLAPFLHSLIANILKNSRRFTLLENLLPPEYFVLIFAAAFGICDPIWSGTVLNFGSTLFIILATAAILAWLIFQARGKLANSVCLTLGIFIIALFSMLFINQTWDKNSGAVTEYLEVFLTFGFALWAVNVRQNFMSGATKTTK